MMKVLFVNACMRGEKSRTLVLCKDYLEKLLAAHPEAEIEEVNLDSMDIEAQTGDFIARRDTFLKAGDFSDSMFDLAKQLIAADHVVIGAPYWDLSFPAKLKMYLERCSVDKLTFIYDDHGVPHGQCHAEALVYITTAGGFIGDMNFGFDYVKGLTSFLFGIKKFYFAAADGIDIVGIDVNAKLDEAKARLAEIASEI
ncbi:MAG: NAD(P)H-dependent oxidoreductase [Firmicutes bacterium]|nr:NAD(P)H-dependent oxidoreductase [Bacillota bacterium]